MEVHRSPRSVEVNSIKLTTIYPNYDAINVIRAFYVTQ